MPVLSDLTEDKLQSLLRTGELRLHVGPYVYKLHSNLPLIREGLTQLYSDFRLAEAGAFVDFNIALRHTNLLSRLQGQLDFFFDYQKPFGRIETRKAYAFLEWGMNWCVSIHPNEYLKLHAAVVAKDGRAILMPGIPGAGKSTLCAAMGLSGWRVLSDEHALIPPGTAEVVPLYRPVSLKNESIPLIANFASDAAFGPTTEDTHKGVVAHLKADLTPDSHDPGRLPITTIVFPRYSAQDAQQLTRRSRTQSFILAAYHSFNYSMLGPAGFQAMVSLLEECRCYDLVYRDLEWGIKTLESLHEGTIG